MKTASELTTAIGELQGFSFQYNEISRQVLVTEEGGAVREFDDRDIAVISSAFGPNGYGSKAMLYDHIVASAKVINPVKAFVEKREWDGMDHIGMLADAIKIKGGDFNGFIRPWMIGTLGKVYRERKNLLQNPVLILLGAQGAGKSSLVRWLGSGWEDHTSEMVLNLSSNHTKDSLLTVTSTVTIELAEFQATLEASTPVALKSWVTTEKASFRAPYGRAKVSRPVYASYIATANAVGAGLLSDPSGNRRYRIVEVEDIDWQYEGLDLQQAWAQALHLYREGEGYTLSSAAEALQAHNAEKMSVPDIVAETIEDLYEDSSETMWASTSLIYRELRASGLNIGQIGPGGALVANAMRGLGYELDPKHQGYPVKKRVSGFGGRG